LGLAVFLNCQQTILSQRKYIAGKRVSLGRFDLHQAVAARFSAIQMFHGKATANPTRTVLSSSRLHQRHQMKASRWPGTIGQRSGDDFDLRKQRLHLRYAFVIGAKSATDE